MINYKKLISILGILASPGAFAQSGLNGIDHVSDTQTRSISPVYSTGAKGQGGNAVTDIGAYPGRELGQGWKLRPSVVIKAGTTLRLQTSTTPARSTIFG